jgi:aryl-alcohol dehydrogenase-like predicted oxidoreductase
MGVLAWSPLTTGWLSGAVREGRDIATDRPASMPQRFDLSIPSNRARMAAVKKLAVVENAGGLTMIQLALGFVTAHPGVTSAIIGPSTREHLRSQLSGARTMLSADILDAIDEIVPPGTDLAPNEKFDAPASLLDASLRRR